MRRAVAMFVAGAFLAALPACGGRTDEASRAAGITPADALALVSVNLDPSIEQKRNLLGIVRRFPGAREEVKGEFDESRDELLGKLLEDSGLDFSRDVEPWLGNEVAMVVLPPGGGDEPLVVAMVETDDKDKARATLEKARTAGDFDGAYRVVDDFVVVSDQDADADEDRALDAIAAQARKDDGGLARVPAFTKVVDQLHGDRLVLAWIDVKNAVGVAEELGDVIDAPFLDEFGKDAGPVAADLHVERGAIVFEGIAAATTQHRGGDARLTRSLPAGSLGAFTLFDVGRGIDDGLREVLGAESGFLAEMEREIGLDLENDVLSWMQGEVVLVAGDVPEGQRFPSFALLVDPSDRDKAAAGLEKLRSAMAQHGFRLEERQLAGASAHVAPEPFTDGVQPAMALFDDRFVLASSPAYLEQLAAGSGGELGDSAAYRSVFGEGPKDVTVQFVALLDPIREALERALLGDEEDRREYDQDVKPNLEPLAAFGVVAHRDGGFDRVQMKLTFD